MAGRSQAVRRIAEAAIERWMHGIEANAAIEFCLVLPVLLLIFGGIVEFGRAFTAYAVVDRLAGRFALAWADCTDSPAGTCNTELNNYTSASTLQNVAPQLTPSALTLRMLQVKLDSAGNISVTYAYPPGTTSLTSAETAAVKDVAPVNKASVAVVANVQYVHNVVFLAQIMSPFLGTSRIINYTVAQLKS